MGHLRLGRLPRRKNWNKVVALLDAGASVPQIAIATQMASDKQLRELRDNPTPGLIYTLWLLTQIPLAARKENFAEELNRLGIKVSDKPELIELVSAFSDSIDTHIRETGGRKDIDEIAQMAAVSTLSEFGQDPTISFLEISPDDVKNKLSKYATKINFGVLTRDFFANFTNRFLSYFLSAELPRHVGAGKRFESVQEHSEFNSALEMYCKERSRIVEDYAGDWFSVNNFRGGITPRKVKNFLHKALEKVRKELKHGGDAK